MTRPRCILCDRQCTPMADYDHPVCPGCDEYAAVMLARIRQQWKPRQSDNVHALLRQLVHVIAEAMPA